MSFPLVLLRISERTLDMSLSDISVDWCQWRCTSQQPLLMLSHTRATTYSQVANSSSPMLSILSNKLGLGSWEPSLHIRN